MGLFYEGDRVRLGSVRGGIVVRHEGQLRVRIHDSRTLLWLDHMVPDEGPDGRIFPNTWNLCLTCSNPTTSADFCLNCEARAEASAQDFEARARRREQADALAKGEPAYGVHLAGPVEQDARSVRQHCARCGVQLVAYIDGGEKRHQPPAGTFREGTLLQRGALGLAVLDRVAVPTCAARVARKRSA